MNHHQTDYTMRRRLGYVKAAVALAILGLALSYSPAVQSQVAAWLSPGRMTGTGASMNAAAASAKDYLAINRTIENLPTDFPKDVIKAIAWCESEWSQFDAAGQPFVTSNYRWVGERRTRVSRDWGIMQINEKMESLNPGAWDLQRIKHDQAYNLRAGVAVLESKRRYIRRLRRQPGWGQIAERYHLNGRTELEITLKAYNGFQPSWAYLQRVKRAMVLRPWDQAMRQQVLAAAVGKVPASEIASPALERGGRTVIVRLFPEIPAGLWPAESGPLVCNLAAAFGREANQNAPHPVGAGVDVE